LLSICFPFTAQKSSSCDPYMCIVQAGSIVTKTYCSILTIPVQALLSGHALTITPSIKCAPTIINLPASTPLIALWSNG
jgi:hypothetical protein